MKTCTQKPRKAALSLAIRSRKYNIAQVARAVGMHKSTLHNHIAGRSNLGIDKALRLSKFLEIPLGTIYE